MLAKLLCNNTKSKTTTILTFLHLPEEYKMRRETKYFILKKDKKKIEKFDPSTRTNFFGYNKDNLGELYKESLNEMLKQHQNAKKALQSSKSSKNFIIKNIENTMGIKKYSCNLLPKIHDFKRNYSENLTPTPLKIQFFNTQKVYRNKLK